MKKSNQNKKGVGTLTLGSQTRQGLVKVQAKYEVGSHISCSRECKKVWGNEPSHSQVSSHFESWSIDGFPNFQRVIVGVITHWMEKFFIPLESFWNVDVWNGLAWPIWTCNIQVIAKKKVRSPEINDIWVLVPWLGTKYIIRGKVVASPKFGSWWVLWVCVCSWFIHAPKCYNYALTNLLFSLCMSMWVSEVFVNLPSPIPKLQHGLLPPKCCEPGNAPQLLFLSLFSPFDSQLDPKELGGASKGEGLLVPFRLQITLAHSCKNTSTFYVNIQILQLLEGKIGWWGVSHGSSLL